MADVGHSRNATRGAKNDTLARVAEDHIVEFSALLKSKLERYMGTLLNHYHFHYYVTLNSQADTLT